MKKRPKPKCCSCPKRERPRSPDFCNNVAAPIRKPPMPHTGELNKTQSKNSTIAWVLIALILCSTILFVTEAAPIEQIIAQENIWISLINTIVGVQHRR